jgi:hypothetical protein
MKSIIFGLTSLFFASSLFAEVPRDFSANGVYQQDWMWKAVEKARADVKGRNEANHIALTSSLALLPNKPPGVTESLALLPNKPPGVTESLALLPNKPRQVTESLALLPIKPRQAF